MKKLNYFHLSSDPLTASTTWIPRSRSDHLCF